MAGVFQNIEPPHRPASVYPRLWCGGRTHSLVGEGGGGSIFWKTPDKDLYSTYVSTLCSQCFVSGSAQELSVVFPRSGSSDPRTRLRILIKIIRYFLNLLFKYLLPQLARGIPLHSWAINFILKLNIRFCASNFSRV
jgi:hypothetical protein